MRLQIFSCCLDSNKEAYLKFQDYKDVDFRIQRMLNNNGQDIDFNFTNEFDTRFYEIIYNDFLHTR